MKEKLQEQTQETELCPQTSVIIDQNLKKWTLPLLRCSWVIKFVTNLNN